MKPGDVMYWKAPANPFDNYIEVTLVAPLDSRQSVWHARSILFDHKVTVYTRDMITGAEHEFLKNLKGV